MSTAPVSPATFCEHWKPRNPRAGNLANVNRCVTRTEALTRRFIQHNSPGYRNIIVLDLDRKTTGTGVFDAYCMVAAGEIPPFNWVTESKSGGAHIAYVLADGVAWTERGRQAPKDYYHDVRAALTAAAGADRDYVNFSTYNPLHPEADTRWLRREPWTLNALHLALRPNGEPLSGARDYVAGEEDTMSDGSRHQNLFADLSRFAYTEWARHYRDQDSKGLGRLTHLAAVVAEGHRMNDRDNPVLPLPSSEVEEVARSVAAWTWKNFHDDSRSERKRAQAMRTGHAKTRAARIEELRTEIEDGNVPTWKALMERYGVSEMTARSYLSQLGVKTAKDDMGKFDDRVREMLTAGMSYTAAAEATGRTARQVRYSAQRQGIKPAGSRSQG